MAEHRRRRVHRRISLLVPYGGDDPVRLRNWHWLREYWRSHLGPGTQIIMGRDRESERRWWCPKKHKPFSKAAAVNDAFRRSNGDIIVILDADAYFDATVLLHIADRLRAQREVGKRSWFVPYNALYRLRRGATWQLVSSSPLTPLAIPNPPPPGDVDGRDGSGPINVFGAMCQVMPREAFETVGGMDPRFRGWGAEDAAFAQALDTLWGPRATTPNDILHLWHPHVIAGSGPSWTVKMWPGQTTPGVNNELGRRYAQAVGSPVRMRMLTEEGNREVNHLRRNGLLAVVGSLAVAAAVLVPILA